MAAYTVTKPSGILLNFEFHSDPAKEGADAYAQEGE
jgi:hypothetical protein